ncbi:hypothetical protein ABBQ38_008514 [Trebouxia sp. C0009 RCD-2024]
MQRHSLSLAELRDGVRLSSPVRHPNAKGGKPAQSQHVNRSPGLPCILISQFAMWVQQATDQVGQQLQVINAELECNARPVSPQVTEAFDKISKQVCSLSEQIALLQLSMAGMQQPVDSQLAANHGMLTASSSITQAQAPRSPRLVFEAQVGLSSGLSSVQEALDEWFTGLHEFPALPLSCEQAIQRGQRLSKKSIDNLSRRRHLPLRIQALATDRCWPLKKALLYMSL